MDLSKFLPKKKSRIEIAVHYAESFLKDLLIAGFTNDEISLITDTISKETKSALQNRKIILENELISTNNAINRL